MDFLLKKYKKIPVQVRASVWFAFCSILQKGVSIITVPIFTRLMTTEQYGYYTTYMSWSNILLVFTSLNLFYGVFNNAMMKYREDREAYTSSMQGLVFTITTAFFAGYLLFRESVNEFLGMSTVLVVMLFMELLVTPALQFWTVKNRFDFNYKRIVTVTIAKTILNPVLGVVLVLFSEQKEVARIVSIVVTEIIICGTVAVYQFYRGKCFFNREFWKYAVLFNLPLIPHYLSGQFLSQSDRIMISKLEGNSAAAVYSVAYNIGLLMNIFTSAINGSYTPWLYQSIKKKMYCEIREITRIIIMLMAVLVLLLMLFGPEAIMILGSAEYKAAVKVIPPVAAGAFFFFLYNIFVNIEFYYEKRGYILFSSVAAAMLNLLLNYIFIQIFGYIAAAYTTLLCYAIYCFLHAYFAVKICKIKGIPVSIFNKKTVWGVSLFVVVTVGIMNFLYEYPSLRYGLIMACGLFALLFRKKLVRIVNDTFWTFKKKE